MRFVLTFCLCLAGSASAFAPPSPPKFILSSTIAFAPSINEKDHRSKLLQGVVCVVTGASRGIGKGIALTLGKHGATVYVTGTSSSTGQSATAEPFAVSEDDPGTIEQTAAEINAVGGRGIAVVCNHANDNQVKQLFAQIESEQGRLDILVNNAFRIPPGGPSKLFGKFWTQDIAVWDTVHTVGLRSHYVASCYAIPLIIKSKVSSKLPRPLIAMISSFGGLTYTFNVAYGVAKAGVDRLAKDMHVELAAEDFCVVSLWPGLVMTERTERLVENGQWEKYVGLDLENSETPSFTGRAIVALATDPNNAVKSGTYQVVAELAQEYQFTDVDGNTPPSIRSLRFLLPTYGMSTEQRRLVPSWMIPDWKLPFWLMARGRPTTESNIHAE